MVRIGCWRLLGKFFVFSIVFGLEGVFYVFVLNRRVVCRELEWVKSRLVGFMWFM